MRCQRQEPGGAGTGVVATAGYFYMAAYGPVTTWSAIKGLYAVPAKPGKP